MLLGEIVMVNFGKGKLTVELLESDRTIQKKIYGSIAQDLNNRIKRNTNKTKRSFLEAVEGWVRSQPEIGSLVGKGVFGSLNAQFGLPIGTAENAVNQIVFAVVKSMEINIRPIDTRLKGLVEFSFQPKDFFNILGLQSGHVLTEKGGDLHWLDWLLTQGDRTIVVGWNYVPAPVGRSGGGEMNVGGLWRVPPEFSGTLGDNFITRAFKSREKEITSILQGLLN